MLTSNTSGHFLVVEPVDLKAAACDNIEAIKNKHMREVPLAFSKHGIIQSESCCLLQH
jgi:hypothetical protein